MHLPRRNRSPPAGIYPTLRNKLFPAIEMLEATALALGDSPTAQDVDDSNIRPLVRSLEPLLSAYRHSFKRKAFNCATNTFEDLVRLAGAYKDAAVIRAAIRQATGNLAPEIASRLSNSEKNRGREFTRCLRKMVEGELGETMDELLSVVPVEHKDLSTLVKRDREILGAELERLLAEIDQADLVSSDLEHLHQGRKALRALLNGMNAAAGVVEFKPVDVARITKAVDALGDLQDVVTASDWLKEKGFRKEAKQLASYTKTLEPKVRYTVQQLLRARTLERVAYTVAYEAR